MSNPFERELWESYRQLRRGRRQDFVLALLRKGSTDQVVDPTSAVDRAPTAQLLKPSSIPVLKTPPPAARGGAVKGGASKALSGFFGDTNS